MTNKRIILFIILLTALTFFNTIFHDYTGDAKDLFVGNNFYKNTDNLSRLFTKDFIDRPRDLTGSLAFQTPSFSGCISYRPVTALTFFLDYFMWYDNPAGHHLTNIILHAAMSLLVFYLCLALTGKAAVSMTAAALFSVHPLQAEAVSSIGYRSDLLVGIFSLASMLAYLSFVRSKRVSIGLLMLSLAFFFLALFSKEVALAFPAMIVLYDDWFCRKGPRKMFLKRRRCPYAGFAIVWLFFGTVYFFIMRNSFYPGTLLLGGNYFSQLIIAAGILGHYLLVLVFPFKVTVLPPLFIPGNLALFAVGAAAVAIAGALAGYKAYRSDRIIPFLLAWFAVMYLPSSNVVSLLNPYAFRFMYLPFVGFCILAALGIERACIWLKRRAGAINVAFLLNVLILGVCASLTFSTNAFFVNSFVAAQEMIRNYPESSRPYWLLGVEYYERGRWKEAAASFHRYLDVSPQNPYVLEPMKNFSVYHLLGRSYRGLGQYREAIKHFRKAIELNPDFLLAYVDLAESYAALGEDQQAVRALLKEGLERFSGDEHVIYLKEVLENRGEGHDGF